MVKHWKNIYKYDFPEGNYLKQLYCFFHFPFNETLVGSGLLVTVEDFSLQETMDEHKQFKDYSIIKRFLLDLVKQDLLLMED